MTVVEKTPEELGFEPIGEGASHSQSGNGVTEGFESAEEVKQPNKTSFWGQVGRGLADPVVGFMQGALRQGELEPPAFRSDEPPSEVGKTIDERVRAREEQIAGERGSDASNIDWPRLLGNAFNPVNYVGGVGGLGEGAVSAIAHGAASGAIAGGLQPAASGEFGSEKLEQVALGGTIGGVLGTASPVVRKVGEFLARNYPEALENRAVQIIMKRFAQDEKYGGPKAKDAIKLVNEANKAGKPQILADVNVTGPNVRGLAGNVARAPGESSALAGKVLRKRDTEALARLEQDISDHVNSGPSAHRMTEALLYTRSQGAKPLYDAVDQLEHIWSPRLDEFLQSPRIKEGLAHGWRLEAEDALAEGRQLSTTTLGIDLDIDGNVKLLDKPNMRSLDIAKRGLDKMIADHRDELTGRLDTDGRSIEKVRRAFLDEIESLDKKGIYKKAREFWSGKSASLDAVKFGKSLLGGKLTREEISDEIAKMPANDREFVRIGVADELRQRLGESGLSSDESKALVNKNKWVSGWLKPVFKSEKDYDEFLQDVLTERAMSESKNAMLGGAATQGRLAEEVYSAAESRRFSNWAHAGNDLLSGHPARAAINAWKIYKDIGMPRSEKLNEAIAKILFADRIPSRSNVGRKMRGTLPIAPPTALPNATRRVRQGASVAGVPVALGVNQPSAPPQENSGGGNQIPQFAEGGIVTQPTVAMIGEQGPEAVVPLDDPAAAQQAADVAAMRQRRGVMGHQGNTLGTMASQVAQPFMPIESVLPQEPSNLLADTDPALAAQQAREAATGRQQQAIQPSGGRQQGEVTEGLLDLAVPGRGVVRSLGQGEYGEAALQAGAAAAPLAGKALGAAAAIAPTITKTAAAATAALTSLFMDSATGKSQLSPESQEKLRFMQQKSKLEQEQRAKDAAARKQEAEEKAARDAQAAELAARTETERQARLAEIEANKQREQAKIEQERQEAERKAAEETIKANAAENKRLAELPFRERHPDAALNMTLGGLAVSAMVPGGTQAFKKWAYNSYVKEWEKLDKIAAKALLEGTPQEQQLAVNRLAAAAQQKVEREGKLHKYPWISVLAAPGLAVEGSMIPQEIDITQPSESKTHQEATEVPWGRMLGLYGGGLLGAASGHKLVDAFYKERPTPAASMGAVKTYEEQETARAKAAKAAKAAQTRAAKKAKEEAKKEPEEPRKAKVPRGGPKIYGLKDE